MSDFNADSPWDYDWNDRGDLAWNEFDWERYLREQDEAIHRYLGFYEGCPGEPNRIDAVAGKMGWETPEATEEILPTTTEEVVSEFIDDGDVYTLHKNPVFIATKAIYLSLKQRWAAAAAEPSRVPPSMSLAFLAVLHRGEEQAVQAIHALDFGDYAMAVSLFKRALSALNESFSLLNADAVASNPVVARYRDLATSSLFDLREIWLRVTAECREELDRPADDEG
jgi:hypothetical protein